MNPALTKHTPLFFKKLPVTEETPPNASYVRFVGQLPKAEAHEIDFHGEKWTVGREDILTVHEALAKTAGKYDAEIKAASGRNAQEKAKAMGMSESTLRKRMALVQNHLSAFRKHPVE